MNSDQALREILEHLPYTRHGDPITTPWGASQWVSLTEDDGELQFFRIVVEPFTGPEIPGKQ